MSQSTHLVTWPLTDRDTISVPVTLVHVTRMRTTPTPPAARRPAIGMIMGPPSNMSRARLAAATRMIVRRQGAETTPCRRTIMAGPGRLRPSWGRWPVGAVSVRSVRRRVVRAVTAQVGDGGLQGAEVIVDGRVSRAHRGDREVGRAQALPRRHVIGSLGGRRRRQAQPRLQPDGRRIPSRVASVAVE